jgi:hypothetical protein
MPSARSERRMGLARSRAQEVRWTCASARIGRHAGPAPPRAQDVTGTLRLRVLKTSRGPCAPARSRRHGDLAPPRAQDVTRTLRLRALKTSRAPCASGRSRHHAHLAPPGAQDITRTLRLCAPPDLVGTYASTRGDTPRHSKRHGRCRPVPPARESAQTRNFCIWLVRLRSSQNERAP